MANPLQEQFDKSVLETEEMYRKKLNSLLGVDSDPLTDPDVMAGARASAENNRKQESLFQERMAADKKASAARQAQKEQEMSKQMEAQEFRRRNQEAAEKFKKQPLAKGGLSDLTGDGEITQADVLKGRGVFRAGGITAKDHIGAAFSLLQDGEYTDREAVIQAARQLGKATSEEELKDLKVDIKNRFARSNENFPQETKFIPKDLKAKIDDFKLGDSTYKTFVEERKNKAEGSLLIAREKYGVGSKVTKLAKQIISGKSRFNKKTEEEKQALFDNIENISDKELDEVMSSVFIEPEEVIELQSKFKGKFKDKTYGDLSKQQLEYLFSKTNEIIEKKEQLFYQPKKVLELPDDPIPFNEGGTLMMPEEGMPVDTYPNIPEDEMDEALESQLPDAEMEENYIQYVMDESLDDEEQDYLVGVLQNDPRLSDILDKVITVASEFSGAGEVEGPGTGVSDSIPARLSDGEFVFTRKATDQIGADQLQTIMDDAERAYDGGYQMKAIGGYMQEDPEEQDSPLSQTDEEIKKLMMGANKMPSLQ